VTKKKKKKTSDIHYLLSFTKINILFYSLEFALPTTIPKGWQRYTIIYKTKI